MSENTLPTPQDPEESLCAVRPESDEDSIQQLGLDSCGD